MWIKLYIFTAAFTRCKTSLGKKQTKEEKKITFSYILMFDGIMHHVTVYNNKTHLSVVKM